MATNNSANLQVTTGGGFTYTFPSATTSLAGLAIAQTFSVNQTFGAGLTIADAQNIVLNTTTGTKIGTATNQKLGFFNATPANQPGNVVDLGSVLSTLGLRAAGTAYPITTSGAVALSGTTTLSGGLKITSGARTAAVTLAATSPQYQLCDATTAAFTITLPTAVGNSGLLFTFKKTDATASAVTIDANASETIDGALTYVLSAQYKYVTIYSNNANWLIVGSN
jgi:hypothetical protein